MHFRRNSASAATRSQSLQLSHRLRWISLTALLGGTAFACDGGLGEAGGKGGTSGVTQSAGPGQGPGSGGNQTVATGSTKASGNATTGSPGPDSATLTWDANTEADLAGYKVYRSEESQMYTLGMPEATIPVGTMTHVSTNLASGRHYFAVTAYDTSGNESALSMEVFKDIP